MASFATCSRSVLNWGAPWIVRLLQTISRWSTWYARSACFPAFVQRQGSGSFPDDPANVLVHSHAVVTFSPASTRLFPPPSRVSKLYSSESLAHTPSCLRSRTVYPSLFRTVANESSIRGAREDVLGLHVLVKDTQRALCFRPDIAESFQDPYASNHFCDPRRVRTLQRTPSCPSDSFGLTAGQVHSLGIPCSVMFAESKAMSTFNLAVLNASTALISMSASRQVRAFFAVSPALALIPTIASRFQCCKCLTRVIQLDMERPSGCFCVCLDLLTASPSTASS